MRLDAVGHFRVARFTGRDEYDLAFGEPQRERRLAATSAADQQRDRHRRLGMTKTFPSSRTTRTLAP